MGGLAPPDVKWVSPYARDAERRRAAEATKRVSRWIVQSVVLATSAFALLDLYLLLTSLHR